MLSAVLTTAGQSMSVEISPEAFTAYLQRLRRHFPAFRSFGSGDEALDASERSYKVELVGLFQDELAAPLRRLPAAPAERQRIGTELIDFFKRRLSDGTPQNLVGWRYWTALSKLDGGGKSEFAAAVASLLYGQASIDARVDEFVPLLKELLSRGGDDLNAWPAKSRSIPSFLLMLSDPQGHAIVKTEEFRRAVESFTGEKLPARPLTGGDYLGLLEFLGMLRESLTEHGMRPRDMIDVQTFVWVGDPEYTPDDISGKAKGRRQSTKDLLDTAAGHLIEDLADLESEVLDRTEREQLAKARIGQGRFRADVAAKWGRGEVCALTGIAIPEMLIASHIKPWRDSSNSERLDPMNGLLLIAHADRLFDRYLMSFKQSRGEYLSVLHPRLRLEARKAGIAEGMRLSTSHLGLSDEHRFERYMSEHLRKHIEFLERDKNSFWHCD